MALSKPVIATDGGGTRELVTESVTGFLVGVTDPRSIAERIDFLLDHPQKAEEMGKAGRKRLETDFNLEKMADNFIEAYRSCLKQ
jgi:glycosyltransferase involved in cell wall biosynthesis